MAHMASTSALLAFQQQQAAALQSMNVSPFDMLAHNGALTGVAAMAAALERQAQLAQSMQVAHSTSTMRNTAAPGITYSTAQSQPLSASALHPSSLHEVSSLPARAMPGYATMSALLGNQPTAGSVSLTQQAVIAAAAAGYQPAGQAPALRTPVMNRLTARIPKLGTVQTYNPATGVRTLTGAAAIAAANGLPAATANAAAAGTPFLADSRQLQLQAASQKKLLTAAVVAAQQQQQQQLLSAVQSVGIHNSESPFQACTLAEQLGSLSATNAALHTSQLAQALIGNEASMNASAMPSHPAAWSASLSNNAPTQAGSTAAGRPGVTFNASISDGANPINEGEDSEDLDSLLHCIGTELARHGISVAAAIEAGWVGRVSPASAAAIEQAHAAETDRLQLRRALSGSKATTLGSQLATAGASALCRSASITAPFALHGQHNGAALGASLLPLRDQCAADAGLAWYDTVSMGNFGSGPVFQRDDPDSVLGVMTQVFTPAASFDEQPKTQAAAAAAAAAASWGRARAPGICTSGSASACEASSSPSAAHAAKEALSNWAASMNEAAAMRDVALVKREGGAARPHLSTRGTLTVTSSDFFPAGLITVPSGGSMDDIASAGTGAPDSGSSNVVSLYSAWGSVSPDTTVHGAYGGALDMKPRCGEAGPAAGPGYALPATTGLDLVSKASGSHDLNARLANLNLGLGFM